MKKEGKNSILATSIIIILTILIYFFLNETYKINIIEKIIITLTAMLLLYFNYKKSIYLLTLSSLTALSMFISLEISFNLNIWIIFIISLVTALIFSYNHEKIKLKDKFSLLLLILFITIWIILSINVSYRHDWILENLLTVPFVIFLVLITRWFKLSNISYTLIFIFMTFHIIGTHYTYSEVPFGYWLQEFLALSRNHYDRIVHFCFGLLLAYPIREIAIRISNLKGVWALYIPIELVLALSAIYEIIEWIIAIIFGGDLGIAYLGTQGDVWDAQKDMALAALGSLITMCVTALIIIYYNSKEFFKDIKESLSVKSKDVLGEKAIEKFRKISKRK